LPGIDPYRIASQEGTNCTYTRKHTHTHTHTISIPFHTQRFSRPATALTKKSLKTSLQDTRSVILEDSGAQVPDCTLPSEQRLTELLGTFT